jgi:hypothetical protein
MTSLLHAHSNDPDFQPVLPRFKRATRRASAMTSATSLLRATIDGASRNGVGTCRGTSQSSSARQALRSAITGIAPHRCGNAHLLADCNRAGRRGPMAGKASLDTPMPLRTKLRFRKASSASCCRASIPKWTRASRAPAGVGAARAMAATSSRGLKCQRAVHIAPEQRQSWHDESGSGSSRARADQWQSVECCCLLMRQACCAVAPGWARLDTFRLQACRGSAGAAAVNPVLLSGCGADCEGAGPCLSARSQTGTSLLCCWLPGPGRSRSASRSAVNRPIFILSTAASCNAVACSTKCSYSRLDAANTGRASTSSSAKVT